MKPFKTIRCDYTWCKSWTVKPTSDYWISFHNWIKCRVAYDRVSRATPSELSQRWHCENGSKERLIYEPEFVLWTPCLLLLLLFQEIIEGFCFWSAKESSMWMRFRTAPRSTKFYSNDVMLKSESHIHWLQPISKKQSIFYGIYWLSGRNRTKPSDEKKMQKSEIEREEHLTDQQ